MFDYNSNTAGRQQPVVMLLDPQKKTQGNNTGQISRSMRATSAHRESVLRWQCPVADYATYAHILECHYDEIR